MNFLKTVINNSLDGLFAIIYPSSCIICSTELNSQEDYFCISCYQELHFTHFEKYKEATAAEEVFWGILHIENVFAFLYFTKGNSTQQILHEIKYNEGKELGRYMGNLIGKRVKSTELGANIDALVPIPVHSKKEFKRGYNQSLYIVMGIAEILEIPIIEPVYRKSHDQSQTKKSKEERYENVRGKFGLDSTKLGDYKHLAIVDDVLTTGSTLEFASRAILNEHPELKISILTVALTQ